ncbi:hypothetical protein NUW58_g637 [Xylaria curta]|uniref:Uncharacterized protein n=1 Tax=Xylaria curta TaxID=42375 RepID=A0ACC1PNL7_9PEZI|nr:hypothetical protein NUW58_g637 [Xylaria curta]
MAYPARASYSTTYSDNSEDSGDRYPSEMLYVQPYNTQGYAVQQQDIKWWVNQHPSHPPYAQPYVAQGLVAQQHYPGYPTEYIDATPQSSTMNRTVYPPVHSEQPPVVDIFAGFLNEEAHTGMGLYHGEYVSNSIVNQTHVGPYGVALSPRVGTPAPARRDLRCPVPGCDYRPTGRRTDAYVSYLQRHMMNRHEPTLEIGIGFTIEL